MRKKHKVMVCVTQQKSCERLLKSGRELAYNAHDELYMVHVVKENWRYLDELKEEDALEYLFETAKTYDASINVKKSKDIEASLAEFVKKNKIDCIVMGESLEVSEQQNMINRLQNAINHKLKFVIVPIDDESTCAS